MTHSTTLILSLVFIVQINAGMQDAETNNHLLLMIATLRISNYLRILRFPALGYANIFQKIPYWHFDTDPEVDLVGIIN